MSLEKAPTRRKTGGGRKNLFNDSDWSHVAKNLLCPGRKSILKAGRRCNKNSLGPEQEVPPSGSEKKGEKSMKIKTAQNGKYIGV